MTNHTSHCHRTIPPRGSKVELKLIILHVLVSTDCMLHPFISRLLIAIFELLTVWKEPPDMCVATARAMAGFSATQRIFRAMASTVDTIRYHVKRGTQLQRLSSQPGNTSVGRLLASGHNAPDQSRPPYITLPYCTLHVHAFTHTMRRRYCIMITYIEKLLYKVGFPSSPPNFNDDMLPSRKPRD
jgi:hypothetical protein